MLSYPPMCRLARRLVTLCSAVSLLLFVAVCVVWVGAERANGRLGAGPAGDRPYVISVSEQ